jgi:hypothetical protein
MIEPTEKDIGRKVVYRAPYREVGLSREYEEGVITSLARGGSVFVRFRGPQGELTPCNRLEWIG